MKINCEGVLCFPSSAFTGSFPSGCQVGIWNALSLGRYTTKCHHKKRQPPRNLEIFLSHAQPHCAQFKHRSLMQAAQSALQLQTTEANACLACSSYTKSGNTKVKRSFLLVVDCRSSFRKFWLVKSSLGSSWMSIKLLWCPSFTALPTQIHWWSPDFRKWYASSLLNDSPPFNMLKTRLNSFSKDARMPIYFVPVHYSTSTEQRTAVSLQLISRPCSLYPWYHVWQMKMGRVADFSSLFPRSATSFFRMVATNHARIIKHCPAFHQPAHLAEESDMGSFKEQFGEVYPTNGCCTKTWLPLATFCWKLVVAHTGGGTTASRPLDSLLVFWTTLLVEN